MSEVEAGIVFHEALVELKYLTLPRYHGQARYPLSGHAVTNDVNTTGVSCDVATNLARTARREVDRIKQTCITGRLLHVLGNGTGAHGQGSVSQIDGRDHV